jgi:hypothetical protein
MAITEGGFFASPDPDALGVIHPTVAGVPFPGGVAAFAAPLLMWIAEQIHENVEPIHNGWCWGWNFRAVVGSNVLSDHAGAVAIDYNAPAHPRTVRNTWTAGEERKIRAILAEANREARVVAWGEDFNTVDGMHFACRGTKAQVIAAGKRLTQPKGWDQVATKAEIREVVSEEIRQALTADNAALLNAIRVGIEAERAEDALAAVDALAEALSGETTLRAKFRTNVRVPVDAELTQRGLGV